MPKAVDLTRSMPALNRPPSSTRPLSTLLRLLCLPLPLTGSMPEAMASSLAFCCLSACFFAMPATKGSSAKGSCTYRKLELTTSTSKTYTKRKVCSVCNICNTQMPASWQQMRVVTQAVLADCKPHLPPQLRTQLLCKQPEMHLTASGVINDAVAAANSCRMVGSFSIQTTGWYSTTMGRWSGLSTLRESSGTSDGAKGLRSTSILLGSTVSQHRRPSF